MSSRVIEAFAVFSAALAELRKSFDELYQVHEPDLVELMREHHQAIAQLQYLGLDLLTEAQQRSIPDRQGSPSAANWLSGLLKLSPGAAKEQVRVAESLTHRNRQVAATLAEGTTGFEQTAAITRVVDGLPAAATHDQRRQAEAFLLDHTHVLDAQQILGLRKKLHDVIDPDGTLAREKSAQQLRGAGLRDHADGTQSLNWRDTDERMAALKAALDPLSAPRPAQNGEQDQRTPAQRRADAMADLVAIALRGDELPKSRGNRTHLLVVTSEDNLRTGHGLGVTGSGEDLSAAAIKRIACDAKITPIRIDANGIPLAVGRTRRTVTPAQWAALIIRDKGCIFPGCDRPPNWCQAHHRIPWEEGGPTDLDNTLLLCDHHHDAVHHHGWDIQFAPDRHPQVIPPAWIDPVRTPRRNTYWRPPPLDLLL